MRALFCVSCAILASVPVFGQADPPMAEFEVASVRPSAPFNGQQVDAGVHIDGAQYHSKFLTLRDYIYIAYKVKMYQVVGPDWIASERFDISAKIPTGASRDKVLEMLQSLLASRFGLKLHRDHKEFPVYALVVTKGGSKLKETPPDPEAAKAGESRASVDVKASGGPQGTTVDYGNGSYISFGGNQLEARKVDMSHAAEMLGRYLDRPVVDQTGLKATYDFKLALTPEDYRAMLIRSAVAAGITLPNEALRLLDNATDDSLHSALAAIGLKLEPRKAPLEVLVIDHVEKTPTEN
jgi:uncharacterized protein (TIGR03435 family)